MLTEEMLNKMFVLVLVFVACVNARSSGRSNVFQMEQAPASSNQDQLLQQVFKELLASSSKQNKQIQANGFSWADCGSQLVNISSLSLQPDPLRFPGTLNVSATVNVKQALKTPLKTELKLYKKEFGIDIEIPCIDGVGSCTYDDVCTMLASVQPCPQQLIDIGIKCTCPIEMKQYKVVGVSVPVPSVEAIVDGDFKVVASIYQGSVKAMCLQVEFEIA